MHRFEKLVRTGLKKHALLHLVVGSPHLGESLTGCVQALFQESWTNKPDDSVTLLHQRCKQTETVAGNGVAGQSREPVLIK